MIAIEKLKQFVEDLITSNSHFAPSSILGNIQIQEIILEGLDQTRVEQVILRRSKVKDEPTTYSVSLVNQPLLEIDESLDDHDYSSVRQICQAILDKKLQLKNGSLNLLKVKDIVF